MKQFGRDNLGTGEQTNIFSQSQVSFCFAATNYSLVWSNVFAGLESLIDIFEM